ncbi:ribonuclease H-like domain-containing protein, partial [Tanacetum coccineum]
MTTARTRAVVNTGKGKLNTDLKRSRWVWRPKGNYLDHVSKDSGSFMLKKGNPEILLQDHAVVDSGCSSHMTGNKAYLSDYEDFNGGFVAFRSDPKGDELMFNLFSVSQMCDKKNSVLFTESECLILSPSFKLLDESQVVLRAPRKDDVYSLDLKNIVLSEGLKNQLSHNVKIVRCDNGTEFKNHAMNEFCANKGIKRDFSVARTPQQNGVTERKNRTLIEAARTIKFDGKSDEGYLHGYSTSRTGPNWMFDLDFLTNSMNYIPVSVENQVNVDAASLDKDDQGSEDAADKEEQHQMKETMDDVTRHAFEEEKRRIASQKKATQATSTNILSTNRPYVSTDRTSISTDRPFVSTDRPSVSIASTLTGTNAGESSFAYLGGKIPIDASTLPNANLPIDPNMPDLEDASDTFPNDGIFNGAYDNDEDVGAVADFHNMDNTITVSPIPTL